MTRTERQRLAIERWKSSGCRGSIVATTGFGKTRTALDAIERVLIKNPNIKVTIIVPTKPLKNQWLEKLDERDFSGYNIDVIIINTAAAKPFESNFLIIDEVHRANADGMSKVFHNCHPAFILGLTATYERLDGKEKLVLDHYAPVCDTITIEESLDNGWIAPYTEYKVLIDVDLTEYNKANSAFIKYFSFFFCDWKLAMGCVTDVFKQQQLARQINCSLKDVKACAYGFNRALQFRKNFIANHPKKLELAKKIIAARPDCKIITFNSSIKQCEAYKMGYVLHSKSTKKKNQMTLEEFSLCNTGVLHTSKMADEGLDVKGLNVAIITGFNSSKISKIQRIGRVVRFEPGKKAEIFTLVLRGTVEEKWHAKSDEGLDYIEINESELEMILQNKKLINKNKIRQEKVNNNIFRF